MTASRDIQTSRATSLQRPSLTSSIAQSLPARNSYNGKSLHSASYSTINPTHRVNRRKSSFSVGSVNVAALAAAAKDGSVDIPIQTRAKGSAQVERFGKSPKIGSMPSPGFFSSSLKQSSTVLEKEVEAQDSSAIEDGPALATMTDKGNSKSRTRRASEGTRMSRTKSNAGELRCETCGKGYKHGSCLTKHLWEHTPEWALTSKLLISKHQQVQLLEAASVLVAMTSDAPVMKNEGFADSDVSSASPAFSGSSDPADGSDISSRTSSPSAPDEEEEDSLKPLGRSITRDSYADQFSHSYRSTGVSSIAVSSVPQDVSYLRRWSTTDRRQSNASVAFSGSPYEQSDLAAAAAGLLRCSIGTPKSGPTHLQSDVPPVPPLPAKYREHNRSRPVSYGAFSTRAEESPRTNSGRFQQLNYDQDVEMDDDSVAHVRGRSEEEDDGIFGTMEQ